MTTKAAAPPHEHDEESVDPLDETLLDPLDPRIVSRDIFELYCYEMIMEENEVRRRAFLVAKMKYMIHRLIGKQYEFGRLYNYTQLANMAARVCARYAYDGEEHYEDKIQIYGPLIGFDPQRWETVVEQFVSMRDSLVRKDADVCCFPTEIQEEVGATEEDENMIPDENDEVDEEKASTEAFSESFDQMKDWIKFHACLSHIQPQFENAMQDGTSVIPKENIIAFDKAIQKHFAGEEESDYATTLRSLFNDSKTTRAKKAKAKGLKLKSFQEIKAIRTKYSKMFDLENFQQKYVKLIRRWADTALPIPNLVKCGYGKTVQQDDEEEEEVEEAITSDKENFEFEDARDEFSQSAASSNEPQTKQPARKRNKSGEDSKPNSKSQNEAQAFLDVPDIEEEKESKMKQLKRKRDSFGKKVKDPIDESVALAASLPVREKTSSAKKSRLAIGGGKETMRNLYEKKKSAMQLKWNDTDDESSSDEDDELKMSKVPDRLKVKEESKPAAQPIQVAASSRPGKRKRFTKEEDDAIMKGIERFGPGQWANIKSHYPMELKDRSTVQIKDRYRTLTKE